MISHRPSDPTKAISAILDRYENFVAMAAAAAGTEVRLVTREKERPDLSFNGDGNGRAMIAICTEDGYRHIVFSRWPDGDYMHPENWPATIPIPDCEKDPFP